VRRGYPPPAEGADPPTPSDLIAEAISAGTILHRGEDLAVPFTWQGETLGVLLAHPEDRIGPPARGLLDLFAWQTAAVLANVRLYAETADLADLKTRMIRTVSHDLKNPLTIVTMAVDMLTDDMPEEGTLSDLQRRYLGMIGSAAETMNTLINSILDLERARRGTSLTESYDLSALLSEVAQQLDPSIQQKKQTLTLDLPPEFPPLSGDPVQIKQVFSNLIGNAVKYTPDLGRIRVRLTRGAGHALVVVEDSGYGISPDAQQKLFQEFYRVRTAETANIPGTGLGLSLVKTIVETHGGRVWVQSEEHQGSSFFVELPLPSDRA
jgi:signal transduction histidine kinase